METITSRDNPLVKHFARLGRDRAYRCACREFLCEGGTLLEEAVNAPVATVLCREGSKLPPLPSHVRTVEVSDRVISAASQLDTPTDIIFSCRMPENPECLEGDRHILLEGLQDPGNVGTIMRTALAFKFDSVIITHDSADPFGPKTVRASMGAVFHQKIICLEWNRLEPMLAGIPLLAATLDGVSLLESDLRRCVIAVGNEGAGVSRRLLQRADGQVTIPMTGRVQSLNAATAAAIFCFHSQTQIIKNQIPE